MDLDMNKYDTHHVTTAHPHMSREEWEKAYSLRLGDLLFDRAY